MQIKSFVEKIAPESRIPIALISAVSVTAVAVIIYLLETFSVLVSTFIVTFFSLLLILTALSKLALTIKHLLIVAALSGIISYLFSLLNMSLYPFNILSSIVYAIIIFIVIFLYEMMT